MTSINRDTLLDAALGHVPFDGWSEATVRAAAAECDVSPETMRAHFPRGAVDLALAYHARGDAAMEARLAETDLSALRFREKVAAAVRFRLEAIDTPEANEAPSVTIRSSGVCRVSWARRPKPPHESMPMISCIAAGARYDRYPPGGRFFGVRPSASSSRTDQSSFDRNASSSQAVPA